MIHEIAYNFEKKIHQEHTIPGNGCKKNRHRLESIQLQDPPLPQEFNTFLPTTKFPVQDSSL